jgi:hypothetical protein
MLSQPAPKHEAKRKTMFTSRAHTQLGLGMNTEAFVHKPSWKIATHQDGNEAWGLISRRLAEGHNQTVEKAVSRGADGTGRWTTGLAGKITVRDPQATPVYQTYEEKALLITGKVNADRSPTPPRREITGKISGDAKARAASSERASSRSPVAGKIGVADGRQIFGQSKSLVGKITDGGRDPSPRRGRSVEPSSNIFAPKVGEVGRITMHEVGTKCYVASTDRLRSLAEVSERRAILRR